MALFLFLPKYTKAHAIPLVTFSTITFIKALSNIGKRIIFFVLIIAIIFITPLTKHQYFILKEKPPYQERIKRETRLVIKKISNKDSLYVLGNMPEIYYFSNHLPVTKYLIIFPYAPWTNNVYKKNIEENIFQALETKNVRVIIKPDDSQYTFPKFLKINKIIQTKYREKKENRFALYIRK